MPFIHRGTIHVSTTMKIPLSRFVALCALFLNCHFTRAAEPSLFGLQLSKAHNIRGLKVPLGMENHAKPTVSVFFGEITIESKRAGFLRIGPIPQPVIFGMRVEILEPEGGVGWAADFARFAAGEASLAHTDIRGIEFRPPRKDLGSVRADAAQFVARSRTLRLRGVEVHAGGHVISRFMAGEVYLEGAKAGRLEWHDGEGIHSIFLSGPSLIADGGGQSNMR